MYLNNSHEKMHDVTVSYRDGKFIHVLSIQECHGITVETERDHIYSDLSYQKALVSSETVLNINMGAYKINSTPDYKEYVRWHVLNYGNPGGGHEIDKLNDWLECKYETSADEVRTVAALFNKVKVTIDD